MREIVLDTETTGLDPLRGDRLVEIGCVEILNRMPTGQTFHRHPSIRSATCRPKPSPCMVFPANLADKPLFDEVVEDFLEFIADAPLVIHNASFDIGFINAELDRVKLPPIPRDRLVDTLLLARRKHPGVSICLYYLPSRYAIVFPPHQARRLARCRAAGRGLHRSDRGPAVAIDPGERSPR